MEEPAADNITQLPEQVDPEEAKKQLESGEVPEQAKPALFCEDMPVRLITPNNETGYFRVMRIKGRSVRLRPVSMNAYLKALLKALAPSAEEAKKVMDEISEKKGLDKPIENGVEGGQN